ncbi:Succinyl-diaminopimelate desuccinylase [Cavenderia fasciculata]|uniref:Succinyl-diaminopimelate desuccinylase n=1 Tax=Cavenderia fasciculata TaxID=261658 RepID=F4QD62_CACFS|nr:Succinyl-diaminopimelate desuccinylase [Cavenderia fasciculata]EGG14533.1 Succinyl-diaminopimelate desuccinylase [Cavenderia fasciculata]|eukprot:XP_004353969.1 Succinyl-diaminopimelate desuccinylase [Cavenderia fasciculata]
MTLDIQKVKEFSNKVWDEQIIPTLSKYIEIPNQSPLFDKDWATNGYTDQAMQLIFNWVKAQDVKGMSVEIKTIPDHTPIIFIVIEPTRENPKNVLLYGHMDKQPPLPELWDADLGPYKAVVKNGKLFGRGGADDGYSTFASIAAVQALQQQNIPHDRYVIIIEGSEESGSVHLPAYITKLEKEIGVPALVVCLDSGSGNYDQLWMTSSLRGVLTGDLTVKVLDQASHSGSASGIVPSSFRIAKQLISRIEDELTGEIHKDLQVEIPSYRIDQIKLCSEVLGNTIFEEFEWAGKTHPVTKDLIQLHINKTWKPTLCVTGVEGIPPCSNAGNVLRTHTTLKLSVRLPPSMTAEKATKVLKEILEKDPPYGASVTFKCDKSATGWDSPAVQPWLDAALGEASHTFYGKPHVYMGEGGTIPFMGLLGYAVCDIGFTYLLIYSTVGEKFPQAQFVITGLLGPGSNAHSGNESLDIEYGKKLLGCIIYMLDRQAKQ